MNHNIVSTSPSKMNLGGGYAVHMFSVHLRFGSQPEGVPTTAIRAYVVDENKADFEMLSLDTSTVNLETYVDDIRKIAAEVIKNGRGYDRLLDAINDLPEEN